MHRSDRLPKANQNTTLIVSADSSSCTTAKVKLFAVLWARNGVFDSIYAT